jgi:hypothetical protein
MFHYDDISEDPKGVKGADGIHVVKNRFGNDCGKIIYESKRTKAFIKNPFLLFFTFINSLL